MYHNPVNGCKIHELHLVCLSDSGIHLSDRVSVEGRIH